MESRVIGSTRDILDMLESVFEGIDEFDEERKYLEKEISDLEDEIYSLQDRIRELEKERNVI